MKAQDTQSTVLLFVVIIACEFITASATAYCNPAVFKRYGWCEQWACVDNCTCMDRPDCRQYCDGHVCRNMRCLSPNICKQKVHLNGIIRPHVLTMFARAPFVTQDCTGGSCDVMRAKRPKKIRRARKERRRNGKRKGKRRVSDGVGESGKGSNAALQNCVEGRCKRLISTLKISKQFCSNCKKMHCFGAHAFNCTQICAVGKCENVQCDARVQCQQACLQNSTCKLKCGKNVKTCLQVCEEGSTCEMKCEAENCKQVCGGSKGCTIIKTASSTTTTSALHTTSTPNVSTNGNEYTSQMHGELYKYENSTSTRDVNISEPKTTATMQILTTSFKRMLKSTLGKDLINISTIVVKKNNSSKHTKPLILSASNSSNFVMPKHLQVLVILFCVLRTMLI